MKRISNNRGFTLIELLVVISIIGLLASIVLVGVGSARDKARLAKVQLEIQEFVKIAVIAQGEANKTIFQISGNGCTECACRGRNIQNIPDTDTCFVNWINTLTKIQNASNITDSLVNMERDPWNAPYGLDENEHEGGVTDCRYGEIRSAGPNGILRDSDDYMVNIPHIICP